MCEALHVCLCLYVPLCVPLCVCLYVYLCVCTSMSMTLCVCFYVCVCFCVLFGLKGILNDTPHLPVPLRLIKKWRERLERQKSKIFVYFALLFVVALCLCLFSNNIFIFNFYFLLISFNISFGEGCYKGDGWIWRDLKMTGIEVHDIKLSKNQ